MKRATFFVFGNPATQGNHRVSRTGYTYDSSKKLKPWRAAVASEAWVVRQRLPAQLSGPLALSAVFYVARPKKPKHPYPTLDLDKLLRALCDGIAEGGLIVNDSQIVKLRDIEKKWAEPGGRLGCEVFLEDHEELVTHEQAVRKSRRAFKRPPPRSAVVP